MVAFEDPSLIPFLPSGFAILPDGPTARGLSSSQPAHSGGSLLTIALQVLLNSAPNAKLSMVSFSVASKLISSTVDKIKHALLPKTSQGLGTRKVDYKENNRMEMTIPRCTVSKEAGKEEQL
ncbi:homeobox-leucine zipper family protein [Striga asiatica]|uniref:Homeobox-leucine zipper family protein n=1 Tax=Striga asiatica TaxID=4170 RepID=A0A5A7Q9G3_STRAF|nr:homeobox-leucine zipper family protein [Striga asiatica]